MPEVQGKSNNVSSGASNKQGAFKDKDKPTEIRMSNITAAKGEQIHVNCDILDMKTYETYYVITAVADAIRTSLGPKGMDKMVSDTLYILWVQNFCTYSSYYAYL